MGDDHRMRVTVVTGAIIAAAVALLAPPPARADPVTTTALVLKVVDGDTIDVVDDNRGRLRVRLLGIDTPETVKPHYSVGCWGPEATDFAKTTLLGQRVAIVTDPTQDLRDRYGRTLAYLDKADGWDYSVEAARAGVAHAYVYDHRPAQRAGEIQAAQDQAQQLGIGLWGPPCFGQTQSVPQ